MSCRKNVFLLTLLSLFCSHSAFASDVNQETKVTLKGNKIYYSGDVDEKANKKVASLITDKVNTLVINSRGGDIVPGMDLGELVYDKGLNVEVDKYCFSSCANYIFPAGKIKYLKKNSLLGWHGGAGQHIDEKMLPEKLEQRKQFADVITMLNKKEKDFFDKIGVNRLSTLYGQQPAPFLQAASQHRSSCVGWSYSIKAMQAFGIDHVELIDKTWQPASMFNGQCIHQYQSVEL